MCAAKTIKLNKVASLLCYDCYCRDDFSTKILRCVRCKIDLSEQELATENALVTYVTNTKSANYASDNGTNINNTKTKSSLEKELYGVDTIKEYIDTILDKVKKMIAIGMNIEDASFVTSLLSDLLSHKKILEINKSDKNRSHYFDKNNILLEKTEMELQKVNIEDLNKSFVAFGLENGVSDSEWYVDSGATSHMSCRLDWIENIRPYPRKQIIVANGELMKCGGLGNISISSEPSIIDSIKDVVYVPDLTTNLISVRQAVERGFTVVFDHNGCNFYRNKDFLFSGVSVLHGSVNNGLYSLDCIVNTPRDLPANHMPLWDRCLGYLCEPAPQQLKNCVGIGGGLANRPSPCDACLGNMNRNLRVDDSNTSLQNETLHI